MRGIGAPGTTSLVEIPETRVSVRILAASVLGFVLNDYGFLVAKRLYGAGHDYLIQLGMQITAVAGWRWIGDTVFARIADR